METQWKIPKKIHGLYSQREHTMIFRAVVTNRKVFLTRNSEKKKGPGEFTENVV